MNTVKMKGKSVEDAIKAALEVLKVDRDSVEIRVIDEGEGGMLGVFGGRDAEVEVKARLSTEEAAKSILQEILDKMGFMAQVYVAENIGDSISLDVKGDDISLIIGKEGQTIDALQYIVNICANKGKEARLKIIVDAGGYRKKQEKRVERIAKEYADEVMVSGKEIKLPPMNARERRIVHMTIKEIKDVVSQSTGEGINRRVVISPRA